MIGQTLQEIREKKGLSLRGVSKEIISHSQLSRIENGSQIPSADKLFHLLCRMNIDFDEFCMWMDDDYMNTRTKLNNQVEGILQKKDPFLMKQLISELDFYYKKYQDIFFHHMKCVLKAHIWVSTEKNYPQARIEVADIANYLSTIESWFYYELTLLNHTLFFLEIDQAIALGNEALYSVEKRYAKFRNGEITRKLFNNLAIHTLTDESYYMNSYRYSNAALGMPQSPAHVYGIAFAKIINQVACFKLQNGQYDPDYLAQLVHWFALIGMDDLYAEVQSFLKEHGLHVKLKSTRSIVIET